MQPKLKWCSQNAESVETAQEENMSPYKFPAYILQYSILHYPFTSHNKWNDF